MDGDITLATLCQCQRASRVISPFIIFASNLVEIILLARETDVRILEAERSKVKVAQATESSNQWRIVTDKKPTAKSFGSVCGSFRTQLHSKTHARQLRSGHIRRLRLLFAFNPNSIRLRYSTALWLPFDCSSTVLRPFDDLSHDRRPVYLLCGCCTRTKISK